MRRLQLDAVARDFAGVHAVVEVSLTVEPGQVVGVIGPNGSGKTTLVNLASGAVAPSAGRVVVDGVDLTGAASPRLAAAGVVRSYQGLRLFEGLSVLDNVRVGAQRGVRPSLVGAWARSPGFRRRERSVRNHAMETLEDLGMASFASRSVGALSHGQRRRVELARAFAARPSYLVLDEPGAGIDPAQRRELAGLIRDRAQAGVGILVVEHDHDWVERVCDRVLGMVDGSVVAEGSFATVAAHPAIAPHLPVRGAGSGPC